MEQDYDIRPEVLTYEDVVKMAPALKGHRKLVDSVFKFLSIDKVNEVHSRYHKTPGIPFSHALVEQEFKVTLRVDNEEVFDRFKEGAFITVSNHPLGAFDGISLLHLVGRHRPDYKVMVNMFLNHLSAMRPSFIAVDPFASDDPEKKAVSMKGIREAMKMVKSGSPIGFFPAGAMSRVNKELRIMDREWQPTILRLIQQMKVPVIPIYFHDRNSTFFNILGTISWQLRTLRLPKEVFLRRGKQMHISVGEPIMPEEQQKYATTKELGEFLYNQTYSLRRYK